MGIVLNNLMRDSQQFDFTLLERLSKLLQESFVFFTDKELKEQFSFACVVQDRLKEAIAYLNVHSAPPQDSSEFYLIFVYAANVFDAVQEFYNLDVIKKSKISNPYDKGFQNRGNYNYFQKAIQQAFPKLEDCDKAQQPTEDEFFKYLRALAFAHPFNTDRIKSICKGGRHYSPYPLLAKDIELSDDGLTGDMGLLVYSNGKNGNDSRKIFKITFWYKDLLGYLISRYETLNDMIDFITRRMKQQEREWQKRKVRREGTVLDTLADLREILEERFGDASFVDELLNILEIKFYSTSPKNNESVSKYREALVACVEPICDAVDRGDYSIAFELLHDMVAPNLSKFDLGLGKFSDTGYHCGKILEWCGNEELESFDQIRASVSAFMKGFAGKWVDLDDEGLPKKQIKLLVLAACHREAEWQKLTEYGQGKNGV